MDGWAFLVADFDREYRVDLTALVADGIGWGWFLPRLTGLSPNAVWPRWRHHRKPPPLEGEALERAFARI